MSDIENTSDEIIEGNNALEQSEEVPAAKVQSDNKKPAGGEATKLFVGSLSFKTDDAGLEEHFASSGKIISAKVITDRETGRSRGFGFVEMASKADAETAIKNLDGKELDGRTLAVSIAQPTAKREGGGGGFRRSAGGGDNRGNGGGQRRDGGGFGERRNSFGGGRNDRDNRGNGGGRGERRSPSW